MDLKNRILTFIQSNHLIPSSRKIVVAVSGGPDSVCLLHNLFLLREGLDIELHIAHLNHQLRGVESDLDARYVIELAVKFNLPYTIEKRNVNDYQQVHRLSLEEAAREVRYRFLAGVADSIGTDTVAAGHTLTDQVETILLHIIRGTGTRGLRGLQSSQTLKFEETKLNVIRPMLEITREETGEYCRNLNLNPRLDSSNLSLSLLRNRVRCELLPLLKDYNPGISASILRIGAIAGDDLTYLESQSRQIWQQIVSHEEHTYIFSKDKFLELPLALKRQLLRMAFEKMSGSLKDIETRHIEEILQALNKPAGRRITLPGGLFFQIEYDRYLFTRNPGELIPYPRFEGEYEVKLPGEISVCGWKLMASIQSLFNQIHVFPHWHPGGFIAEFDKDLVGEKLLIRTRRKGDVFQPLGLTGLKKVGEFMLDARIPRLWRDRIPVVCTPDQIIWVAGYRIDDRVKVTSSTSSILTLRLIHNTP